MNSLSQDVALCILVLLDVKDALNLGRCSRSWRQKVNDELLWSYYCRRDFHVSLRAQAFRKVGWKKLYIAMRDPVVLTWGCNEQGRLGRATRGLWPQDQSLPQLRPEFLRVRGGLRLQVDEYGHLIRQRDADDEENDVSQEDGPDPIETYRGIPGVVESMRGKSVSDICCGGFFMLALTVQGQVWFWGNMNGGYTRSSPVRLDRFNERIVQISCGRMHATALSETGIVYFWKDIENIQQIVLPDELKKQNNILSNIKDYLGIGSVDNNQSVVQICSGWSHYSILTREGDIYSSLDINVPNQQKLTKALLEIEPHSKIIQLAAGDEFTLGLSQDGHVYLWNQPGQSKMAGIRIGLSTLGPTPRFTHITASFLNAGLFTENNLYIWKRDENKTSLEELGTYPEFKKEKDNGCIQASFGDWHYGVLDEQGRVHTWGAVSDGASGHSLELQTPTLVPGLQEYYVFHIAFAGWHSAALAILKSNLT